MNLYSPVISNFMFKTDDIVYHKEYGAGKVIYAAHYNSKIIFDVVDEDIPDDKIMTVKNKDIRLFDDVIKIGDRVKNKEFGFGTIIKIMRLDITNCLIKFDEPHDFLFTLRAEDENDRKNKMWCVPKNEGFSGFKVIKTNEIITPPISADIMLRDMYQNICEDLPGREKEFLDNVEREYINFLDRRIESEVRDWAKKYGYFLEK